MECVLFTPFYASVSRNPPVNGILWYEMGATYIQDNNNDIFSLPLLLKDNVTILSECC